ncbi:hypothetical protein PybrP1_012729 [[Pythium] brassicae (nom. inval.)]|nr:hypothetical protein PybrP1_012729 [[Pythium] brassicae (nom. inval.)]
MSSARGSFLLSSPRSLAKGLGIRHHSSEQIIGGQVVSPRAGGDASKRTLFADDAESSAGDNVTEGPLFIRIHVRRLRYCVLRGRTLLVFDSKDDAAALSASGKGKAATAAVKKTITVVGVRSATEIDRSVRASLLGIGGHVNVDNALVVSTPKSKLVLVEAETPTEKQRWLHAMSCLNFASSASERAVFLSMLQDGGGGSFDAHVAVSLLHKYRDNAVATEVVVDRLAEYAEHNIDDVEFYVQQIVHLVVNAEMAKTEKLVNLLLSICKAKTYVEHLGNCIHLALQLFWLLEAKIADKEPRTYNLCAKLLMSIEAKVVNQHFELPVSPSSGAGGAVSAMLMEIPGMKVRLDAMAQAASNQLSALDDTAKAGSTRPEELSSCPLASATANSAAAEQDTHERGDPTDARVCPDELKKQQRELLLQWMEKERQKRYKYFHQQRDFIKALADISERMRAVDPPDDRKKHLPAALEALAVPDMAYIPLGRVSDPFCRITRVLKDEGTVFSTHSRAPCLLCFEVIEDHVNAAGQRSCAAKAAAPSGSALGERHGSLRSSVSSALDEEAEIVGYIKKLSIKGKFVCLDQQSDASGGELVDDCQSKSRGGSQRAEQHDATRELERQLGVAIAVADDSVSGSSDGSQLPSPREDTLASAASSMCAKSSLGSSAHDETSLILRHSQSAYEFGLSKMLSEGGVFGESWQEKKERIRASSSYGHLPGWNVISLISKSNDDIRQEVFAMQLISKFQDIFRASELPLFLRPYRIVSTGKTCGLLETITDAQSLDALKKRKGYEGLRRHFERTYGDGDARSMAMFGEFVQLFVQGMCAAQRSAEQIITLVEIMMRNSTFPCFQDRDVSKDLQRLRDRFLLDHSTKQLVQAAVKLISASYKNKWTKRYDQFQKITNGIIP